MNNKKILLTTLLLGSVCGAYSFMNINICDSYAVTQYAQVGTTTANLNLRTGASTKYAILTTIPNGSKVTIVNKQANGWYKVQYGAKIGYVSGDYLKVTTQAVTTPDVTATQVGTTTDNLNMRTGSSTNYAILLTIPKGKQVDILHKESNGWYRVQYNGKIGYVSGLYLKITDNTTTPSIPSTDDSNTSTTTGIVNTTALNVRSGASTSYKSLGTISKGTKVTVLEQLTNGWAKISFNGTTGYVNAKYLDIYKAPVISNDSTFEEIKALANKDQSNSSITKLVNKNTSLPSNYTPANLVTPNVAMSKTVTVTKTTATALEKMFADAKAQGINLTLVSGYRSYSYQQTLYNNSINTYGQAHADKYVAKPGQSEHQTGLAVDISCKSIGYVLEEYFKDTPEAKWLKDNAHKYGFILRYTNDRVKDTGYSFEPWHFRYVGTEIATYLYENNLIYEDLF